MANESYELVIAGGGPAGLTAGIYAARARLKTLLLEKLPLPGGLAATTHHIENYPGFPEGVTGQDLSRQMADQARGFGLEIVSDEVISVDLTASKKNVTTSTSEYSTEALIIASGTRPKTLNVPGESRLTGRGVSYCATCDGPIFAGKNVAVIGTGNSGLQEGIFLSRYVKSITFVEVLSRITGDAILQERIKDLPTVTFHLNHAVAEIEGSERVESLSLTDLTSEKKVSVAVEGVFIYVGTQPSTEWIGQTVELDEAGFVITDEELRTSVEGVFAAGDVRRKALRQVTTAVGDGALAAFMAEKYLSSR